MNVSLTNYHMLSEPVVREVSEGGSLSSHVHMGYLPC